jgi:hypothetical protein
MQFQSFNYTDNNLNYSEKYTSGERQKQQGQGHLPKHLITDEVRADERNFIPADPPGKYEIA